jgi:hypothetical protein
VSDESDRTRENAEAAHDARRGNQGQVRICSYPAYPYDLNGRLTTERRTIAGAAHTTHQA